MKNLLRNTACLLTPILLYGLSACSEGVLAPQGPVAHAERTILLDAMGIMLAIGIPTILAVPAFAWWFRSGNKRARRQFDYVHSSRVELVVWSIPILVILFLGGLIWVGSHDLDPFRPLPSDKKPLEVQVVSLDWKWLFLYPDQNIATVNMLEIPVGRPVHFTMTSASVLNSFNIPALGGMMATMNGMTTQLSLQADQVGTYEGRSTHFSGDGFSKMHFAVQAVPDAVFSQWVNTHQGHGPALTADRYADLAKPGSLDQPIDYGSIAPDLFKHILDLTIPPGPGADEQAGNTSVHPKTEK